MAVSAAHTPPSEQMAKERRVLELRRDGLTFDAIARHEDVGYAGPSSAKRTYERALRRTLQPAADLARKEELDRIDDQYRIAHAIAANENLAADVRLRAVGRMTKISERRSALQGLDAPTRVDVQHTDALDAEIAALVDQLLGEDKTDDAEVAG